MIWERNTREENTTVLRTSISYVIREVNDCSPRREPDDGENIPKKKPVSHIQDENSGIPACALQSTRCLTKTWPSKVV
jgi:hypothetical protein